MSNGPQTHRWACVLMILAMAACGDEESVHDVLGCTRVLDGFPGTFEQCERACVEAVDEDGPECLQTSNPDQPGVECDATFEFEGTRGCCRPMGVELRFFECVDE